MRQLAGALLFRRIECRPQAGHDFGDIGLATLPAFDLEGGDARIAKRVEMVHDVEADRVFEGVAFIFGNVEAPLAQGRVAGRFARTEPVDGEPAQFGDHFLAILAVAHMARGRAHAVYVGGLAGDIGGERAPPFGHDAEPAEGEHFEFAVDLLGEPGDLGDGEDPRQHQALGPEALDQQAHRIDIGGRGLHGDVQALLGIGVRDIVHQRHVGQDHRIGSGGNGIVGGAIPEVFIAGAHEGVEGHIGLDPPRMSMGHRLAQFLAGEV